MCMGVGGWGAACGAMGRDKVERFCNICHRLSNGVLTLGKVNNINAHEYVYINYVQII